MTQLADERGPNLSRYQRERYNTPRAFRYRSLWLRLGRWGGLLSFNLAEALVRLLRDRDLSPVEPAQPSDQRGRYNTPRAFRYRSLWSRLGNWGGLLSFNPALHWAGLPA